MTFKQFKEIVEKNRKDVIVYENENFFHDKNKKPIMFIDENGEMSKVYEYSGSYQDVLKKLGIKCITKNDVETIKALLNSAIKNNGKKSIFTGVEIDTTKEIEEYRRKLEEYSKLEII